MKYRIVAVSAAIALAGWIAHTSAEDKVITAPYSVESAAEQSEKAILMQAKLKASSTTLDGLVNGDFTKIKTSAALLSRIAETSPRRYADLEEMTVYEHFRDEFIRQSNRLEELANEKNLEGAAYLHQSLTQTCIACHQHVRTRTVPPLKRR